MRRPFLPLVTSLFALLAAVLLPAAQAAPPRVLPEGKLPNDRRLGELTTLNSYFPFEVSSSPDAWQRRAERLRRQLRVALGLWPMPAKTPHKAVVHGKIDCGDYTVEKVYLQSFPGHFVTGNLYRPKGKPGPLPGVLCPHGHWSSGRFHDMGLDKVRREIMSKAEKFEAGGRSPLQARCVHLARLGCVVFHYDMIGYADSVQIAHRPGVREVMNTKQNWGFFSPQAESRLQTMMGLQSYNSIRALDWLAGLEDVDPKRIAVTGASGGGTQTFILCAIDPRPAVAFPAVMVSTAMQGGCTCENASYLRVGTGNVEIAALFSPKPLGLTAANDWTKEMQTKGFPELRKHYAMLDKPSNVMLAANLQFGHNYNYVSRAALYGWLNEHLELGRKPGELAERDYKPLSRGEMSVWNADHPQPPTGDDYERSLLRTMTEDAQRQVAALVPHDAKSLAEFRRVVGGAWDLMIHRRPPRAEDLDWNEPVKNDRGDYREVAGLLKNEPAGEEVPVLFLHPKKWNKQVVIWVHEQGKAGLYGSDGSPAREVRKLLAAGCSVVGVDLLYQGEFLKDGQPLRVARLAGSGRGSWKTYAGYTFGYNQSLFAQRVSDLLTVISFIRGHKDEEKPEQVHLLGLGAAGPWAAAAKVQAGAAIDKTAVDTAGFRFQDLSRMDDPHFLPGAVKYGDLPAALALCAPGPLWLAGEAEAPKIAKAAYQAAGKPDRVATFAGPDGKKAEAAVMWLLK